MVQCTSTSWSWQLSLVWTSTIFLYFNTGSKGNLSLTGSIKNARLGNATRLWLSGRRVEIEPYSKCWNLFSKIAAWPQVNCVGSWIAQPKWTVWWQIKTGLVFGVHRCHYPVFAISFRDSFLYMLSACTLRIHAHATYYLCFHVSFKGISSES